MICNILISAFLAIGLNNPLHFHNVLPECGNVFSIAQDDNLDMWFGTNTGFYRYDGYNTTKYTFGFYHSVADARRRYQAGVYCDGSGGVWVSYKNLYKFDKSSSSFFQLENIEADGITDIVDYNGTMLLACDDGIKAIGRDDLRLKSVPAGLSGLNAYRFFVSEHSLYVVTKDYQILQYNPSAAQPRQVYDISFFRNYPIDIVVRDGEVWVAADGGGIATVNGIGECKRYRCSNGVNSLCSDFVRSIAFDTDGNLWASTGSGLSILDRYGRFHSYQPNNENRWSLSKKSLIRIFRDADGGMWLGSVGGGVDYCCSTASPFATVDLGEQFDDVIGPIAEDSDGSVWIGTSRSGVFHYFPESEKYSQFLISSSSELNDVKCIYFSRDGIHLYFGFARNELAVMNRKTGNISVFSPFESSLTIMNILEDSEDNIWLGTSDGIFFFDKKTKTAIRALNQASSAYVTSMTLGQENKCIFCAFDNLFSCRLSLDAGTPAILDLVRDERVSDARSVIPGKDGTMMVCSDKGMSILEENGIVHYSEEDGLSSSNINSVVRDGNGMLWAGTRNGLNMIDRTSGKVTRFYDSDNLPSNYFSENSCMLSSDGTLYFGTVNGLVRFNPGTVEFARPSHTPRIAYISVSGEKQPAGQNGEYSIDAGMAFSLVFGVNNYSSLTRNVFFYRLLPTGQEWNRTGPGNSITFSNLKHGRYIFELKSENAYGDASESQEEIVICVKPFWYQTLFAKIVVLLSVILLLVYCSSKIKKTVSHHYELKIKHVEQQSAETILENSARSVSVRFLSPDELSLLVRIISSIQNHMQDPDFSIEKLADDMCMSRSNLHRKIKSMTGMSATDLLQKYRMEKSAELLSQSDYSVETISEMVGYSSSSYFIQAFKKYYNTTPGKLRQS